MEKKFINNSLLDIIEKRLIKIRKDKKLTRPQVSKDTGIPIPTLIGWELNRYLPRLDLLVTLSKYYKTSIDYIVGITDNPEVNK